MNLGRSIVSTALRTGTVEPYLEVGMDITWLQSPESRSIFGGEDRAAYQSLLRHWAKHTRVNEEIFRRAHPEYRLAAQQFKESELLDMARHEVRRWLLLDILNNVIDMEDEIDDAVQLVQNRADRLKYGILARREGSAEGLSAFDFEPWVLDHLPLGVPLGIPCIDEAFGGFQRGQLITLVGRQKSTKSTLMAWSAIKAWEAAHPVLFYNVELDKRFMRQKLYSIGAHVNPERLRRGPGVVASRAWEEEIELLREFHDTMQTDAIPFWISQKYAAFTVKDILADVERYQPRVVYIDGFYFMEDKYGDSAATDHKAIEHIAADLAALSMEKDITVMVSTQAQEKQQGKRKAPGIEAKTIQGGTGLLKASSLVLGLDTEPGRPTVFLNDVRNRFGHLDPVDITWDWDRMNLLAAVAEEKFEEKEGGEF